MVIRRSTECFLRNGSGTLAPSLCQSRFIRPAQVPAAHRPCAVLYGRARYQAVLGEHPRRRLFHAAALSSFCPRATILIALSAAAARLGPNGAHPLARESLPLLTFWATVGQRGAAMPQENYAAKQQRIGELDACDGQAHGPPRAAELTATVRHRS
jgi:hypothetical protein